ncbi:branched-chain-amino-acid aminotransferase, cytosolic-like isoform X2 [Anneissia japonica]|uniref:branched-chain-amino-acid aminotransferase, cytosolic-like isoform X2 n=1 Tax=Anneissia japonica TaxID=1529436 RepID=UPI0014255E91|nr:branched-chain-amino-acid aminotransferase, cytosolic-like isoform X2 [Anneissia japonica]
MAFSTVLRSICVRLPRQACYKWNILRGGSSVQRMSSSLTSSFKVDDLRIQYSNKITETKPDSDTLIFGHNFTDHMLTVAWSQEAGWEAPCIQPFGNLPMHPASSVLHYGIELFEGMKAYCGDDNKIRLFRPWDNMTRMRKSAEKISLPDFDGDELVKCISQLIRVDREWVPKVKPCSLYIRPTFISTEPTLGVNPPGKALLYVILCPVGPYFRTGSFNPVSLYADRKNVRAWKGGSGDSKIGGNYGPTIKPQKDAEKLGCQQVLWLYGDQDNVTEVGTMNMMMMWHNMDGDLELITPPLDGTILPGVTRKALLELAHGWGEFKVTEKGFTMEELQTGLKDNKVLEVFGAGTACVVCPVGSILYKDEVLKIPTMDNGAPYATRFYNTLLDIQYGNIPSDWVYDIDSEYDALAAKIAS